MASITSLAPELLQRILEFSEPPEHLNLALTCQTLHARLDYILRHSQDCHRKYRAVSDIDPSTIPNLVCQILIKNDWVAAWHIRAIEIWGYRSNFKQWKPYRLTSPSDGHPQSPPTEDAPSTAVYQEGHFTDHELAAFKKAMLEVLRLSGESGEDGESSSSTAENAIKDIKEGAVGFLSVLLMALSPRLQAIRFVRSCSEYWAGALQDLADCIRFGSFPAPVRVAPKTFGELQRERANREARSDSTDDEGIMEYQVYEKYLRAQAAEDLPDDIKRQWPPGFLSVQEIAVGLSSKAASFPDEDVPSEDFVDGSMRIGDHTYMRDIVPLMRLPRLKSLWVHGFSDQTDDLVGEPAEHWNLPVGCSTVQNLVFDYPVQPSSDSLCALIKACGKLKHLTFINGGIDRHTDCDIVLAWCELPMQVTTLESVLWCRTEVHGYRSDMFCPEENSDGYAILTVSINDLIIFGVNFNSDEPGAHDRVKEFGEFLQEVLLGHEARVLVIHNSWGCSEELLEQALIRAVRAQCWDECWDRNLNDDYDEDGNLKENLENSSDADKQEESSGCGEDSKNEENGNGSDTKQDVNGEEDDRRDEEEERFPCGCLPSWENHNQYPYFPNKAAALYLEDIDPWINVNDPLRGDRVVRWQDAPQRDPTKRSFGELIRLCKLWGVEIHTRTTPAPRVHSVAMPAIASEKDLMTSPWYKHPTVERLYFKPHLGLVDDCGNCGECQECYRLHPPECWAKWKEEDAQAEEERRRREDEEESEEEEGDE